MEATFDLAPIWWIWEVATIDLTDWPPGRCPSSLSDWKGLLDTAVARRISSSMCGVDHPTKKKGTIISQHFRWCFKLFEYVVKMCYTQTNHIPFRSPNFPQLRACLICFWICVRLRLKAFRAALTAAGNHWWQQLASATQLRRRRQHHDHRVPLTWGKNLMNLCWPQVKYFGTTSTRWLSQPMNGIWNILG